jgi:low temperature requirement protein LtrA
VLIGVPQVKTMLSTVHDSTTVSIATPNEPFDVERLLALAIGFTGTVALWWCYFQRTEAIGIEVAENAADAGCVAWWATWTLMLMVLALIGIAVGDELAIAHPGDEATLGFTIFTFGGPALFLLAQVFFLRNVLGTFRAPGCWDWWRLRSLHSPPRRSR